MVYKERKVNRRWKRKKNNNNNNNNNINNIHMHFNTNKYDRAN